MEASEFRVALARYVGSDNYRRFIRFLNGEGRWRARFLFWQEELLAGFAATYETGPVGFARIEPLLRVCELHGAELIPDPDGLSQRCHGAVTDFTRVQAESFPNTDCGPLEMGCRLENFRRGLWFCPTCRVAEAEWRRKN